MPVRPILCLSAMVATTALVLTALVLAALVVPAHATGDIKAGRQKALQCQACHGLDGLSKRPDAPNIGGQPLPYLVKVMTDYKTGARKNEMMSVIFPALSDQDIADLAAYYAAVQITATPPPR